MEQFEQKPVPADIQEQVDDINDKIGTVTAGTDLQSQITELNGNLTSIGSDVTALKAVTSTSVSGMQTVKKCGKLVIASWVNKALPSANGWQTLFTLPTGYRPANDTEFTCWGDSVKSTDAFQAIEGRVNTDGTIKVYMYAPYQGKLCGGQVVFFT